MTKVAAKAESCQLFHPTNSLQLWGAVHTGRQRHAAWRVLETETQSPKMLPVSRVDVTSY